MNFLKKKSFYIPAGIISYLILFATLTKLAGVLTMIGVVGIAVYLFTKSEKFKSKGKGFKTLTTVGLAFMFLFLGVGGVAYNPELAEQQKIATQKETKVETKKQPEVKQVSTSKENKNTATTKVVSTEKKEQKKAENKIVNGELKVHYIDVGQADSILIQQGNNSMLIDAGNNADSELVKSYIQKQGITSLQYVIGTHPHEDHIGGLDYVINSFKIGNVFMPKKTATTRTFEDVLNAVKNKGLKITQPSIGQSFNLGEAKFTILAPNQIYDNANDCSIVVKLTYGSNSFLFTGDAEGTSEMSMVNSGSNISADVLKVGHHGSKTSTVTNFLNKVNPKYAVVSVGKGNKYKHPSQGVMDRLKSKNVKVYRTDENGTIIATSNGKDIKFNCNPASYKGFASGQDQASKPKTNSANTNSKNSTKKTGTVPKKQTQTNPTNNYKSAQQTTQSNAVYITPKGKKYHRGGCRTIKNSSKKITRREAENQGYTPCKVCNP